MFDSRVSGATSFTNQSATPAVALNRRGATPPNDIERTVGNFIKYYPWMIAFVVLIHALYLVYFNQYFGIHSTNLERVVDDSFILFGELVILFACVYTLRRIRQLEKDTRESLIRRARLAIIFITISALCNVIGQCIWIWYDGTLPAVPFPGIDDVLFLSNYPFFFVGIALLIPRGGSAVGRARVLVDATTLVLSVVALFWYLVLGPTLATLSGTALVKGVSLAYPVSDLAAAVTAILLYFNPFSSTAPRRTLARLTLGIAVSAISNMIYGYAAANGTYYTGQYIDVGFTLTWLLIAWAVFTYPSDLEQMIIAQPEQASSPKMSSRVSAIFRAILPLLFTLLTSILLLLEVALRGSAPIEQILLVCAGLFFLPVVRQSLTLIDNSMLNERLNVALSQSQSAFHQSQNQLISTTLRTEQLEQLLGNIENLQEVHASLARGDLSARAMVQGPLAPVALSLNLLIERMNRWAQARQINHILTEEANWLCQVLDTLSEGKMVPRIPSSHNHLPTGNALLITGRLQARLRTRFQRQRDTIQIAVKRLQLLKEALSQMRSEAHGETLEYFKIEQFLMVVERSMVSYELQLQELWKQSNIYEQNPEAVSPQRTPSTK